jgi:hypothetical protein
VRRSAGRQLGASFCLVMALGCSGCRRDEASHVTRPPAARAPTSTSAIASRPFSRAFADITRASGLEFRHVTGAYGSKLLPETLGSGAAFLDHDGDGLLDIFLVNSCWWPGDEPEGAPRPRCALFRGLGDGRFEEVTESTGAGVTLYGMGCSVADYDGDGDDDIYITAAGDNVLLRNQGGIFEDVTGEAGVAGGRWRDQSGREHAEWSTAAAWADVDLDGDLDLLVTNYVEWTAETEIFTSLDGKTKAFTTPDRYRGLPCRLYLNDGEGSFTDATVPAGLAGSKGKSLGIAFWDFDADGRIDFVVANDTRPNFLFLNRGGGRFEEAGLRLAIAYDESGRARAGMGIDIADYANDGFPGVAIGNFGGEPMSLYRWAPEAGFSSEAAAAGLGFATFAPLAFGVLFADLDLDGVQDLVVVNGHIEPDIARFLATEEYEQSPQLFQGRGDGTFADASREAGPDFSVRRVGRGLAVGDIDGDGDLDLLITTNGGSPVLLRNEVKIAQAGHFLRVRLRGKGKNTRALGATVRLTAGGVTQTRMARTGSSYLSQSESTLTFGLGTATRVERLVVRWPLGAEKVYEVEGIDRTIDIEEE